MADERRSRPITIKVLVHIGAGGEYWAAGVVRQEWNGAVRVSHRLVRSHPMPNLGVTPNGVHEDVWRAYLALSQVVQEQIEAAGQAPD